MGFLGNSKAPEEPNQDGATVGPCGPHPGLPRAFRQEGRASVSKGQEKGCNPELPSWNRRNRQSLASAGHSPEETKTLPHLRATIFPGHAPDTQTHHKHSPLKHARPTQDLKQSTGMPSHCHTWTAAEPHTPHIPPAQHLSLTLSHTDEAMTDLPSPQPPHMLP